MIRHIVIINFRKGEHPNYMALLEETRPLIEEIPSVLSYHIYKNMSHYTPENIESFGVELKFKYKSGLDEFMSHPKHYEANAIFERFFAEPPYMVLTYQMVD